MVPVDQSKSLNHDSCSLWLFVGLILQGCVFIFIFLIIACKAVFFPYISQLLPFVFHVRLSKQLNNLFL